MNKRIEALSKFDINISIPETFDDLLELLIDTNEQFKQTDNKELISIISSIIDSTDSYSGSDDKKLPNITSDAILSQVVSYVDGNGKLPKGVTEEDKTKLQ